MKTSDEDLDRAVKYHRNLQQVDPSRRTRMDLAILQALEELQERRRQDDWVRQQLGVS